MSETINTEGPTPGGSYAVPPVQNTGADVREGEEVATPAPAPEATAAATETTPAPTGDAAPVAPTPEEQAEIDAMVDYTIKEEDIATFKIPQAIVERDGLKVGDVIKVAKDHPLVTGTEVPATPEGGTPTV